MKMWGDLWKYFRYLLIFGSRAYIGVISSLFLQRTKYLEGFFVNKNSSYIANFVYIYNVTRDCSFGRMKMFLVFNIIKFWILCLSYIYTRKYISLNEFFVFQAAPFYTIIILLPSSNNLSKSNDSIFCLLSFFVCLFQTHFVCIFSIFFMYLFFFCLFYSDIFWFRFLLYSFIFCFLSQTYSAVNFFFALFFYFFFVR